MNITDIKQSGGKRAMRAVIYGPSKVGKTTFCAQAPDVVFLPIEDGLVNQKVAAFPIPQKMSEVYDALRSLATDKHNYKTLVVDSLDWLEKLCVDEVCRQNRWKDIEAPGFGKGYTALSVEWRKFIDALDYLNKKKINIVCICHDQIQKFEPPMGDPYDYHALKLHKRLSALTCEWADLIGFCSHQLMIKKTNSGFGNTRNTAKTNGERLLMLASNPAHMGGNRFDLGDIALDWDTFQKSYFGEQK